MDAILHIIAYGDGQMFFCEIIKDEEVGTLSVAVDMLGCRTCRQGLCRQKQPRSHNPVAALTLYFTTFSREKSLLSHNRTIAPINYLFRDLRIYFRPTYLKTNAT